MRGEGGGAGRVSIIGAPRETLSVLGFVCIIFPAGTLQKGF